MITRTLVCLLTDDDVLDRGRALASANHDYVQVEEEKAAANREFKQSLDAIGGRITQLADAIRDKQEERDVPCIIENDDIAFKKRVIRTDTREVIET